MKRPRRLFRNRPLTGQHDLLVTSDAGPLQDQVPDISRAIDVTKHAIACPFHRNLEFETQRSLLACELLGMRVDYAKGASAIDVVRNLQASEALASGLDSLLFIDGDMRFEPQDVVRFFESSVPVLAGVYAAKILGKRARVNCNFAPEVKKVKLGEWATELYPIVSVGAGFLRIKCSVFRHVIEALNLPLCEMGHGHAYPLFQPTYVQDPPGTPWRYLSEDYAFCWRCRQVGIPMMADTSFRLYHIGDYSYGWEEARGFYLPRERNVELDCCTQEEIDAMAPPPLDLAGPALKIVEHA